ncbi:MAG: NAD(P)/FAD-dependent oxidoreductase [Novosphingobium sp.]|nr:NAD(P)/FAD-dependent oxidoreductase [Novosphingobium sp.]
MAVVTNIPDDLEIDVEALSRKYAEEREKRLRADGLAQYEHLTGAFAWLDSDPWADPAFTRNPVIEDTDVLLIGGGFAGLLAGTRLRLAGVEAIRIVEKGGDFGGAWYWNRYPGAACDVESYIYLPLIEEMGYIPTEKYAKATEIYNYCRMVGERFDLYRAALFQTVVREVRWNAQRKRWIVSTDRADEIAARFVMIGNGLLTNPKLPGIPGILDFKGKSFHTSRWDYGYTGGSQTEAMEKLADKVVGIIGTGATAVQAVPELAKSAKHLYVFQRTPSSIDVRANALTPPDFGKGFAPGWARRRRDNFSNLVAGGHEDVDMVADGWTDIIRHIGAMTGGTNKHATPQELQLAQMRKMEMTRRRIDAIVRDPATAEALKPWYNYFCKRPCFHDEYLQTFNRPNVPLVDTRGKGVERVAARGPVVEGREYPVDLLIFATGFDMNTGIEAETGIRFIGPQGQTLTEHWKDGLKTLYGIQTRGFPNLFIMNLLQAGVSVNYMHIADEQTIQIAHIISRCLAEGVVTVQPTQEAQGAWVAEIRKTAEARAKMPDTCTPGAYNQEGQPTDASQLNTSYAKGPIAYIALLEKWREEGWWTRLEISREA